MLTSAGGSTSYVGSTSRELYYWNPNLAYTGNLLGAQSAFDSTTWLKTRSTVTANTSLTVAPDNTNTAEILKDDASANASHYTYQNLTGVDPSQTYTYTVYLKANTRTEAMLLLDSNVDAASYVRLFVNLSTGTITQAYAGGTGVYVGGSIQAAGNGWYRVSVTGKATATAGSQLYTELLTVLNGSFVYTGNGSGIFVWGGELTKN
jgi:hypothetical protein